MHEEEDDAFDTRAEGGAFLAPADSRSRFCGEEGLQAQKSKAAADCRRSARRDMARADSRIALSYPVKDWFGSTLTLAGNNEADCYLD